VKDPASPGISLCVISMMWTSFVASQHCTVANSMLERRVIQELSNANDDAEKLGSDFEQDIEDIGRILKYCWPPFPWNQSTINRKKRALSIWNGVWEIPFWYIILNDALEVLEREV
jgi:hypothetical protein